MKPAEKDTWCSQDTKFVICDGELTLLVVDYAVGTTFELNAANIQHWFWWDFVFDHVEDVIEDAGIRIHSFQPLLALPVLLHLRSTHIENIVLYSNEIMTKMIMVDGQNPAPVEIVKRL